MTSDVYVHDLGDAVERIVRARETPLPERLERVRIRLRSLLHGVSGIQEDLPLIVYGEQPDPPLIKHVGKSLLAEVLRRKLEVRDVEAKPVHMALYRDIFGSNAAVFTNLGLLSARSAETLGRQTYAHAPTTGAYVVRMFDLLSGGLANVLLSGHLNLSGKADLSLASLIDLCKNRSIGEFNMAIRERLEERLLPYKVNRTAFTELEETIVQDPELYEFVAEFAPLTAGDGENTLYVTWRQHDRVLGTDSGYRRNALLTSGDRVVVREAQGSKELFEGTLKDVRQHERYAGVSLNAASRAAMVYALTSGGAQITGGGSTYNEVVADAWIAKGLPAPILLFVANEDFRSNNSRLLSSLLATDAVSKVLKRAKEPMRTDDPVFAELVR